MEAIKVNTNARLQQINETATELIKKITKNAEAGISSTDLYIPKDIHSDVRDLLESMLKASNTRFMWQTVARGFNEYTGRPESYQSETTGYEKHRRITILN
jgi:hypothetical protein